MQSFHREELGTVKQRISGLESVVETLTVKEGISGLESVAENFGAYIIDIKYVVLVNMGNALTKEEIERQSLHNEAESRLIGILCEYLKVDVNIDVGIAINVVP